MAESRSSRWECVSTCVITSIFVASPLGRGRREGANEGEGARGLYGLVTGARLLHSRTASGIMTLAAEAPIPKASFASFAFDNIFALHRLRDYTRSFAPSSTRSDTQTTTNTPLQPLRVLIYPAHALPLPVNIRDHFKLRPLLHRIATSVDVTPYYHTKGLLSEPAGRKSLIRTGAVTHATTKLP